MRLDEHVHAEPLGRRHHCARFFIAEHREHRQHGVGAVPPRLGDLARIDDEVLGEDRPVMDAPDRRQVVERAAEEGPVGEHADRVGDAGISSRLRRRIGARPDRAGRRRGLLHLHDEARAGPGQRRRQAEPGRLRPGQGVGAAQPRRDVDPLARDDLAEDAAGISHC
jgi:hypothetical protein